MEDKEINLGDRKAYIEVNENKPKNVNFYDYQSEVYAKRFILSGNWDDSFKVLVSDNVKTLYISGADSDIDIGFISKYFKHIKRLIIRCNSVSNESELSKLTELEYLYFGCFKNTPITFNLPENLNAFVVDWKSKYKLFYCPQQIEYLSINGGKKIDWKALFTKLINIEKLDLEKCDLEDGTLILSLPKLKYLALDSCKNMIFNYADLQNQTLKYAHLTKIKLNNIDFLLSLKTLDILILESCFDIRDINSIDELKSLRGLMLTGNTNIIDGDLDNLRNLKNLKNCFIVPKKHYSLKTKQPWSWTNFELDKKQLFND